MTGLDVLVLLVRAKVFHLWEKLDFVGLAFPLYRRMQAESAPCARTGSLLVLLFDRFGGELKAVLAYYESFVLKALFLGLLQCYVLFLIRKQQTLLFFVRTFSQDMFFDLLYIRFLRLLLLLLIQLLLRRLLLLIRRITVILLRVFDLQHH